MRRDGRAKDRPGRAIPPEDADTDQLTITLFPGEGGKLTAEYWPATVSPERLARRLARLARSWCADPARIRRAAGCGPHEPELPRLRERPAPQTRPEPL